MGMSADAVEFDDAKPAVKALRGDRPSRACARPSSAAETARGRRFEAEVEAEVDPKPAPPKPTTAGGNAVRRP